MINDPQRHGRMWLDKAGEFGRSETEQKTGSGRFPQTRQNSRDFTILDAGSGVTTEMFHNEPAKTGGEGEA